MNDINAHPSTGPAVTRQLTAVRAFLCAFALLITIGCGEKQSQSEEDFLNKGHQAVNSGNYQTAIITLKNMLEEYPNSPHGRLLLGQAYFEMNDFSAAETQIRRSLDLGVSDALALPDLVAALAAQGKHEEVLKIDAEQVGVSERAPILMAQAIAKASLGKQADAETIIQNALDLAPDSAAIKTTKARIVAKSDQKQALDIVTEVVASDAEYAPATFLQGSILSSQKELNEAEIAFTRSIQQKEEFAPLLSRAIVRIDLGKTAEAQADIDKARPLLPGYYELDFAQGLLYFRDNKLEAAKASLQAAYTKNNEFLPVQFYLATVQYRLGELDDAEMLVSNYIFKNQAYLPATLLLAQIENRKGKHEEALKTILPALDSYPENLAVLSQYADASRGLGNRDEELEVLKRIQKLQPDSSFIDYRIGSALLAVGESERAIKLLKDIISNDPSNIQATTELVNHYSTNDNYSVALELAKGAVKASPSAQSYNLLGITQATGGDLTTAKTTFEKTLTVDAGNPYARNNLALLAIQKGDYRSARNHLNETIKRNGPEYNTLMRLASIDELENKTELMESHLKQAQDMDPQNPTPTLLISRYYLNKGQANNAQRAFGQLAQQFRGNPQVLETQGRIYLALKNYSNATAILKNLTALLPKNAEAHYLLSQAFAAQGDVDSLKYELNRTLEINPDHFLARLNLAQLFHKMGKIEDSKKQIAILKSIAPENTELAYLEGLIARDAGDSATALASFEKVLSNAENTKTLLSVAQQEWDVGRTTEAIARVKKWLETNPDDVAARLYLARFYADLKNTNASRKEYERVLTLNPDNIVALNNLAWLLRSSDTSNAIKYGERAVSVSKKSPETMDTLMVVLMEAKKFDAALKYSDELIKRVKLNNAPSMYYHRAELLAKMGEVDQSHRLLDSLSSLEFDFEGKSKIESLRASLK